ncbi:MAG: hypothetical protein KC777_06515 [Cyanobacteria bacterium HKST-UBA02]|nr:hypothetical protein [Cyanobacteria bacterium HKST-UBA02]
MKHLTTVFVLLSFFLLPGIVVTPENQSQTAYARSGPSARDLEDLYDEVWRLVDNYFLFRDRLDSWDSWRHRFDGALRTTDQAETAINDMLDSLSDEYTYYRNQKATEKRKELGKSRHVVEGRRLATGIGYLRISTFNSDNTLEETRSALLELRAAHGYIIDLRDNWGGSIDTAFDVFSLLANQGKFVTMEGTSSEKSYREELVLEQDCELDIVGDEQIRTNRNLNLTGLKPMAILVNSRTKSAAEMLAGSLKDNGRAILVGETTFGKGIVQRVWDFPNQTSIKISSAFFYLPSGKAVHRIGLKPDVQVGPSPHGAQDKQLSQASELLRRGLVSMLSRPR